MQIHEKFIKEDKLKKGSDSDSDESIRLIKDALKK